ncbi:hypothetical protein IGI04_004518 [Brassica rapa subsp. trilocularis]|uniref:Uncharacterized protein n=1 Tax=Brassica rapa subsp. trilocularis TaxID=1813537 RepID=A0ABQ7NBD3_BRACM|nr:hypothetical protein IGI04_004518 [Brassica rapa subsp. trilocularis]
MSALSPSIKDKSENNEEGVLPTGLVKSTNGFKAQRRFDYFKLWPHTLPSLVELRSWLLLLRAGFITVASGTAAALLFSEGLVKRCTISLKVLVSVWTNVVTGLQVPKTYLKNKLRQQVKANAGFRTQMKKLKTEEENKRDRERTQRRLTAQNLFMYLKRAEE